MINPLDYSAFLSEPQRTVKPHWWLQHVPFAMFLIDLTRPKLLVELGTHTGTSYSAFCQAVKELSLDTHCYAVDNWQGDPHEGFYGNEILDNFKAFHDPLFGTFSKLVQTTFDDAARLFSDQSIDLLHIDGYHTYEAVKHDFQTWLPKMSSRGIVLLHDISVRKEDFGVWKYWSELKEIYPTLEFVHGMGLGIVFVGSDPVSVGGIRQLFSMTENQIIRFQEFFFYIGSKLSVIVEKEEQIQEKEEQIQEKEEQIQEKEEQIQEKEELVRFLRAENSAQIAERDHSIQLLSRRAAEKERELVEMKGSKAWRLALKYRRFRAIIVPPNSRRARMLQSLVAPLKKVRMVLRSKRDLTLIRSSGLFDQAWYLASNPDVAKGDIDAARHYLLFGGFEGRDPGPGFPSRWYLETYPDVFAAKTNPLVHYLRYGKREGRSIPGTETRTSGSRRGIILALSKVWRVFRRKGIRGVLSRVYYKLTGRHYSGRDILSFKASGESNTDDVEYLRIRAFNVVPYYLDPHTVTEIDEIPSTLSIAVHLHVPNLELLDQCVKYLNNIPARFDLYVSMTEDNGRDEIVEFVQNHISLLGKVIVKMVPNRGRDLAPLIIDFGKDLRKYDFVAHIHAMKDPQASCLGERFEETMKTLLGSPSNISQIFKLLSDDGKFVYPAPSGKKPGYESGWGDDYALARDLLRKLLGERIKSYPLIEFPQGSMFWATTKAVSGFLRLRLRYADFPLEGTHSNESLVQVLMRLLLISANKISGRNYRVYSSSSTIGEPYFESQNDYSNSLVHKTVRVLSYFLPQFYAIPENDMWHGKGFTEWTKVRSANPLFYGHYQQHVPHKDLGYYLLDSTEMLRKQAELMRLSGVHGQIFYHYWFGGKLILEKPSQMLLADKSIEMPFCFCWANENWTRKWDGNENEILLGQKYSEQDAIDFINYLLPFFKDERYVKIAGRPVLFIYRPASIPDPRLYEAIWQKVCAENGMKAPFIVAVLTRGAKSPKDFGMDAGCERVLHDWTDGNVKDIKSSLYRYWPINGSVLSYNEVVDYYLGQTPRTDFTYFRSIIASWDNTPRYGSEALLVHGSTPDKFQEWLEALLVDAEERLPEDQRFVVVNAWNEWAECAVIEPDNRYGFAYLNSIGRALSGTGFNDREYMHRAIPETARVSISIGEHLLSELQVDLNTRRKMLTCIAHSTVLWQCEIAFEQPQVAQWMSVLSSEYKPSENNLKPDYILHIKDVCYFAPDTIENMLRMALHFDVGVVTPTHQNDPQFNHLHLSNRWETNQVSPYFFLEKLGDKRSMKCCVDAGIFISQPQSSKGIENHKVSTIIRFSQSGCLELLENALYSLIAQVGCTVQPIIAVQDLTTDQLTDLETMLKEIPWDDDCFPIIKRYSSSEENRDLRSLMLNDSLKTVDAKYMAFLDYDDLMFHDAYAWLIERLCKTKKNVSFGLVYSTVFNLAEKKIKTRKVVYDYGWDYVSFLENNQTPIHGFMLNMSQINREHIEHYSDMKYMEDYFLTLQIFTKDDTDWASLEQKKFVGDYIYLEDQGQTLANLAADDRRRILARPDYQRDQARIDALREKIRRR